MSSEQWRCADVVEVPNVVGLHIRDAQQVAHAAGVTLAQPDPDGPPLAALTWPDDYEIIEQQPAPGSLLWRWDPLVVRWSTYGAGTLQGQRPPRLPLTSLDGPIDYQTRTSEPDRP